jgi:hypothetical protein
MPVSQDEGNELIDNRLREIMYSGSENDNIMGTGDLNTEKILHVNKKIAHKKKKQKKSPPKVRNAPNKV